MTQTHKFPLQPQEPPPLHGGCGGTQGRHCQDQAAQGVGRPSPGLSGMEIGIFSEIRILKLFFLYSSTDCGRNQAMKVH